MPVASRGTKICVVVRAANRSGRLRRDLVENIYNRCTYTVPINDDISPWTTVAASISPARAFIGT